MKPKAVDRIVLFVLVVPAVAARAVPTIVDDFEDLGRWSAVPADGVSARITEADGKDGKALRLDFEFLGGGGFCVVRRPVAIDLPANYRISFSIRGDAPSNNFEFKLIDASGENVWWVNRRNFEFPKEWTSVSYKARHFRFAWGPSGGKRIEKLGAIEFAVAAGSGGKGSIWIDSLEFEALPEPQPVTQDPIVTASSVRAGTQDKPIPLHASGKLEWRSDEADTSPWVEIDFGQFRELGGLVIDWDAEDHATDYEVLLSTDGARWETAASVRGSNGGRDYVPIRDGEAGRVRVRVQAASRRRGVGIRAIQIKPVEFAETQNAMFASIARDARPGLYPRYFLRKQTPWTVIGVPGDDKEALLDALGALEVDKLAFRVEPFIVWNDRLITWADVEVSHSLAQGYLPVPSVSWEGDAFGLDVTAFADGEAGASSLIARYRLTNCSDRRQDGLLVLAIRPFQVLPPWQELNITGGVSPIESIELDENKVVVNGDKHVRLLSGATRFGASPFAGGEVHEYLASGRLPESRAVRDPDGLASAAIGYSFDLDAGESKLVAIAVPFHGADAVAGFGASDAEVASQVESRLRSVCDAWVRELNRVRISVPPSASKLVDTFRTTQAYILINADGPSIQPGSRTYERSWIRDGALTSTALLSTGHSEKVREFLDWYADYQYPSGKVPCVVDARGADPVPEHDSTGELIYALLKYYRFTRDRAFLERHLSNVVAGVDYIESLRAQRLTEAYKDGPPEMRACYGLVPESISHEGYSAKPMHSYWDSFFVLKGLEDATTIAEILGKDDLEARFGALRDAYRVSLYDSMRLAMQITGVDYIPGCVELGDFDATSTAIGVFPCGQLGNIPEPQLGNTFDRYFDFFLNRRDGAIEWDGYTPYEVRLIGTFVRLGRRDRAHELLTFFFRDQRPPAWNQWAEVVTRDPDAPRFIGDMPHTWVGSDYVNAVRSLFVYERERDASLVLAAGVPDEWIASSSDGVSVEGLPTEYGRLSYRMSSDAGQIVVNLDKLDPQPARIILHVPSARPIQTVTVDGTSHQSLSARKVVLLRSPAHVVIETAP